MPEQAVLRLVDTATGELTEVDDCPRCRGKDETIETLGNKIASLKGQLTLAMRELDEGHELFPAAKRLFDHWRQRCRHPNSQMTIDRFKAVEPHLRPKTGVGEELCRLAIDGAAYDPMTKIRRNGSVQRFDSWELIFRSRDKVEDFANRAPYHLPKPEHVKIVAEAHAFIYGLELDAAVEWAQERLR